MVIRVECHIWGHSFHNARAARITESLYDTNIENRDVGGECSKMIGTKLRLFCRPASLITSIFDQPKFKKSSKIEILDSQPNTSLISRNILKGPTVSNVKTLNLTINPGMQKQKQNWIVVHCAVILWAAIHHYRTCANFLHKECSSLVSKIFETYFLSYQRGKFVKTVVQTSLFIPCGTSVATIITIWCSHRDCEYFLHQKTRKLGSTATSPLITRILPLKDYISGAKNETMRALFGHTNRNIEMCSPSAAPNDDSRFVSLTKGLILISYLKSM